MSDDRPTLDYAKPRLKPSVVPAFGMVACAVMALAGVAIVGFGIWLISSASAGPMVTDQREDALKGGGICVTGVLLIGLSLKWLRDARRQRLADRRSTGGDDLGAHAN